MREVILRYGPDTILLAVPEQCEVLQTHEPAERITPTLFRQRVRRELTRLRADLSRTALIVADKTRVCEYETYLTSLIDALIEAGLATERLTVYIGYGTHQRQSEATCRKIYGETYDRYHFIHHDCMDSQLFCDLGTTSRGTPILIRRDVYQASFLITFGAISHHYFAGFGGGRKLVFPGVAARESIYHNHGLFLDRGQQCLSARCCSGVLDGNPVAEDLAEIEAHRRADLAVHGILNSHGQVCDLLPGHGEAHFRDACAQHAAGRTAAVKGDYDLVIASCGGSPKDINLIQSHKAIHNAAAFVRDGGDLVVLAACPDGLGSETFLPWFEQGEWGSVFDRLATRYEGNGGTALAMLAKLKRIRIHLLTHLDPLVTDRVGLRQVSAETVNAMLNSHTARCAVIPNAGLLVRGFESAP